MNGPGFARPFANAGRAPRRGSLRNWSGGPEPLARLVCFGWCGAGASAYRRLAPGLPGHIELLAVQLPGREELFGEPRLRRMEQVVEHVLPDIAGLSDRPLFLFGHSMGALVAFEMALALKARLGREPQGLIVSGHTPPRPAGEAVRGNGGPRWHEADDAAFLGHLGRLGGTPPEVLNDAGLMRSLLPVLRADYEVLETYRPSADAPMLSCPLIACAGVDDKDVAPEGLAQWRSRSTGRFTENRFPGGHFYLCAQPGVLTRCLADWTAPGFRAGPGFDGGSLGAAGRPA
jgi:surfactin synthase thioesterase subunit